MSSFDVVSEVDRQELKNAVDQAQREIGTRFDFKNTESSIEQKDLVLTLRTVSEDRLAALRLVVEEKLVKRGVSLKGVEFGKMVEATQNTVRQLVTVKVGIGADKAREINRMIKEKGPKGISSQTQGESVRVNGKKRDDLQAVIALLKGADLGIPLEFDSFRECLAAIGRLGRSAIRPSRVWRRVRRWHQPTLDDINHQSFVARRHNVAVVDSARGLCLGQRRLRNQEYPKLLGTQRCPTERERQLAVVGRDAQPEIARTNSDVRDAINQRGHDRRCGCGRRRTRPSGEGCGDTIERGR